MSPKDTHFMNITKKQSLCKFSNSLNSYYSASLFYLPNVNKDQVCLRIFHRKVSTNHACGKVAVCNQRNVSSSSVHTPTNCLMSSEHKLTSTQSLPEHAERRILPWSLEGKQFIDESNLANKSFWIITCAFIWTCHTPTVLQTHIYVVSFF